MKTYIVTTFAKPIHDDPDKPSLDPQTFVLDTITVLSEDDNFIHDTAIASIQNRLAFYGYYKLETAAFDSVEALDLIAESFPHNPVLPVVTPAFLQGNQLTAQWTREWREMLNFIRNKAS